MTDLTQSPEYQAVKAKAAQLREESMADQAKEEKKNAEVKQDLHEKRLVTVEVQGIQVTAEVADMFKQTSQVGMENVTSQSLPQLKVIEDKSKDVDINGSKIKAGSFFYSPTKEVLEKPIVSLVTVSKGFYTVKKDQNGNDKMNPDGTKETRFNQLVGGINLSNMSPFVLFAAGIRWKPMNDFVKSIKPFTKHKQSPIPMYAFQVQLSTVMTDSGNYAVAYTLVKNEKGFAQIVTDKAIIDVLLASIDRLNEMIDGFIAANEVDRFSGELLADRVKDITVTETTTAAVDVDPETRAQFDAVANPEEGDIVPEETDSVDVSDDIPF